MSIIRKDAELLEQLLANEQREKAALTERNAQYENRIASLESTNTQLHFHLKQTQESFEHFQQKSQEQNEKQSFTLESVRMTAEQDKKQWEQQWFASEQMISELKAAQKSL